MGLFAVEAVPRGTPVWRFEPGFDQVFTPEQIALLPWLTREHIRWFAFFRPEDGHAVLSGDHACFMNHSDAPNTGAPPGAASPVTTVALRDIAAGEELTCHYHAFDAESALKLKSASRQNP
ncbi:MAG: SET domain-containing protein [Verrucomicrobia bacterium]|nr:SET domain-containing protein [Verrucomicrobiota bacterium]